MKVPLLALASVALAACNGSNQPDALPYDVVPIDLGPDAPSGAAFCSLPGNNVQGATLPNGFCMRSFAQLTEPRVLAFAPNGDLFVATPSQPTAGGASGGAGAIMVLSDDNHDGTAEVATFASGLRDVHGLAIGGGFLYFTTEHAIFRTPYMDGLRREMASARTMVATFDMLDSERWTHGLGLTPGGTLYATQGVYSAFTCPDTARNGNVQQIDPVMGPQLVASGFRNPMYMRCHFADEMCMTSELGDDGGGGFGAHEKLVWIHPSTNYGFPCCTTTGMETPSDTNHAFDCNQVTREEATFALNSTPFGLDWERGVWPMPFTHAIVVALHGSFYSSPQWAGARVVFAATDPTTHTPVGDFQDLVDGFGPNGATLERPADVAFAPDGRLFIADDQGNAIYWVAPSTLRMQ